MSSFTAKRKARVIKVDDEEGSDGSSSSGLDAAGSKEDVHKPLFGSKSGRKPFRQSGLRKTFNPGEGDTSAATGSTGNEDAEDDGPVVVRPNRPGAGKQKKKGPKTRLSFGGDPESGDSEDLATPKQVSLGQRALENSAVKRGIAVRTLPTRSTQEGEEDRPRYSKEYLDELQSSTPSTPQDISNLHISDADEMELDPSELDGALVVEYPGASSPKQGTQILSEAEIRERKERRARLAQEQGFLSVEDDDTDAFGRKKKDDGRLLADDEDLGEGFDDYVEDGGLSLGKRAEKERRKKERKQMAELITAAEGHSSDDSSDSDAERRMAYEASQSKAGLDGLKKPRKNPARDLLQIPPKITPLPSLSECLTRLQATLREMENDLKVKNAHLDQLRKEREDIVKRETEVQALLDETGKKYQEAMAQGKIDADAASAAGPNIELVGERGLDSLGTTPRRPDQSELDAVS
ncbi:hypothetical protein X797_002588 [Metarhizium robertsii]|uniref:Uncharacterized protein n=2 Tax=Metarhizium robertsii TaxID=568076 RepID=E9EYP7_METRA|nr:uncharacterized protein MAA_05146 [Metarhizium robertsii ARSEF 23]EFY99088.1 hypothetical protein MAA_05146 [Metarhizium robertsii ARSEF 23]EXV04903.1 hypothetical protein X797_002588 [Metarhizium robertsii]